MLIQYLSDIHLEFFDSDHVDYNYFFVKSAEHLVLAGDIGYPTDNNYKNFIKDCSQLFNKVFIIAGNHEYYINKPMSEVNNLISIICSEYNNVFFLNNTEYKLTDNIVILGTVLWSKINNLDKKYVELYVNDYKKIKDENNNLITAQYINNLYNQNFEWLRTKVEEHQKNNNKIIIITHHSPSYKSISPKYKNYQGNSAFANNLDNFIINNQGVKYWLFGHTHSHVTLNIKETMCLANPAGYIEDSGFENKEYKSNATIEI
jgi:predicted phosphodiesterase